MNFLSENWLLISLIIIAILNYRLISTVTVLKAQVNENRDVVRHLVESHNESIKMTKRTILEVIRLIGDDTPATKKFLNDLVDGQTYGKDNN